MKPRSADRKRHAVLALRRGGGMHAIDGRVRITTRRAAKRRSST
jgi:hypothetical protein